MSKFLFPPYEEIARENAKFAFQYRGYGLQVPITDEGLFLRIDCRNVSVVRKEENVISFSLCNKGGFPIAQHIVPQTRDGYLDGCCFIIDSMSYVIVGLQAIVKDNVPELMSMIRAGE